MEIKTADVQFGNHSLTIIAVGDLVTFESKVEIPISKNSLIKFIKEQKEITTHDITRFMGNNLSMSKSEAIKALDEIRELIIKEEV